MNAFSFVNKCVSNGYNKIMAAGEPVADVRAAMHSQGFDFLTVGVPKENTEAIDFWEKQGFTVRKDITYRNKALAECIRTDT